MKRMIILLIMALVPVVFSCKKNKPVVVVENNKVNGRSKHNEGAVLKEISRMVDVIYEWPDSCVNNPDSFLSSLKFLPETNEGKEMYEYLLLNTAYLLREHGRVLPGIRYYEKALAYYKEHQLDSIDFYDYIAKPLGSLYTITGDFEKAAALQQLAITTAEKENRTDILPALYGNQAITFRHMNRYDSVLSVCRKGLVYSGGKDLVSARLYNEMAKCFLNLAEYDSARYYTNNAIRIFRRHSYTGDTIIWFSSALMLQSELDKRRRALRPAIRSINQAIALTEQHYPTAKNREKAKFYQHRGSLMFSAGNIDSAIADFGKVRSLLKSPQEDYLFPDNTITDALSGLARCYWETDQQDSSLFFYARSIENDYIVQRSIVSKESNYLNSRNNRFLLHEALDRMWQVYAVMAGRQKEDLAINMLWCIELSKGRQLLMEIERTNRWQSEDTATHRLNEAKNALRYLWDAMAEETDSVKLQQLKSEAANIAFDIQLSERYFEQQFRNPDYNFFAKNLHRLSERKNIVSWQINEQGNSFAITIDSLGLTVTLIPDTILRKADINLFIQTYFQKGPEAYNEDPALYCQVSAQILKTLIPGEAVLRKKNWLLSPDGMLYALPVDALCRNGKFLAEEKNIAYTYTLLLTLQEQETDTYYSNIEIFSKSRHKDGLADLQYVEEEQEAIASHFKSKVYPDTLADEKKFLSAMNTKDVLHVATHAVVDSTDQPYLVLSRKLTLDKIHYAVSRSPLVVLSACQTASGQLLPAEGMESLNRALLSKGIKGVIASQWPVNDQTMVQIVSLFYEELYNIHLPDEALANAKRKFLKQNRTPQLKNPWYWASLNYSGVPVMVVIERRTNRWYWLITVVAVTGALWMYMQRKWKKEE